jgi:hypothetical protein
LVPHPINYSLRSIGSRFLMFLAWLHRRFQFSVSVEVSYTEPKGAVPHWAHPQISCSLFHDGRKLRENTSNGNVAPSVIETRQSSPPRPSAHMERSKLEEGSGRLVSGFSRIGMWISALRME